MKNLNLFEPLNPKSDFYQSDFLEAINKNFIQPLEDLGFDLLGTSSLFTSSKDESVHILIFKKSNSKKSNSKAIHKICTQEDDSQPCSTYSFAFNTLFLMIPILS